MNFSIKLYSIKCLCISICVCGISYAQQDASITVKGSNDSVTAIQEKTDTSSQKQNISVEGDSNKIYQHQKSDAKTDTLPEPEKPGLFKRLIENSNSLVALLTAVAAMIAAWQGILFLKKRKKK